MSLFVVLLQSSPEYQFLSGQAFPCVICLKYKLGSYRIKPTKYMPNHFSSYTQYEFCLPLQLHNTVFCSGLHYTTKHLEERPHFEVLLMQPLPTKEQQNKSRRNKFESECGLNFLLIFCPIDRLRWY